MRKYTGKLSKPKSAQRVLLAEAPTPYSLSDAFHVYLSFTDPQSVIHVAL